MSKRYVISLDEGTTSARAVLIDKNAHVVDIVAHEFEQIFPHPGMRHEIHNEPGRAAVFSDISNWIGEVL